MRCQCGATCVEGVATLLRGGNLPNLEQVDLVQQVGCDPLWISLTRLELAAVAPSMAVCWGSTDPLPFELGSGRAKRAFRATMEIN